MLEGSEERPTKRPKIEEIIPVPPTQIEFEKLCKKRYGNFIAGPNNNLEALKVAVQTELLTFVQTYAITEVNVDTTIYTNELGKNTICQLIFFGLLKNEVWAIHFLRRSLNENLLDKFRVEFTKTHPDFGILREPLQILVDKATGNTFARWGTFAKELLLALVARPWSRAIQWHVPQAVAGLYSSYPLLRIAYHVAAGHVWPIPILLDNFQRSGPMNDRFDAMSHSQIVTPLLKQQIFPLIPIFCLARPDLRIRHLFKDDPLLQVAAQALQSLQLLTRLKLKKPEEITSNTFQLLPLDVRNIIVNYVIKNIYQKTLSRTPVEIQGWYGKIFLTALNTYSNKKHSLYDLLLAERGQPIHEPSILRIEYAIKQNALEKLRQTQSNGASLLWLIAEANDVRLWLAAWEMIKDTITFEDLLTKPESPHFNQGHKTILALLLDACADMNPQKTLIQTCLLEIASKYDSQLKTIVYPDYNTHKVKHHTLITQNSFVFNLAFPMFNEIFPLDYWLQLDADLPHGPLIVCLFDKAYEKVCKEIFNRLTQAQLMALLQLKFTTLEGKTNGLHELCQKASALPGLFSDIWQRSKHLLTVEQLKSTRKIDSKSLSSYHKEQSLLMSEPVFFLLLAKNRKEELNEIVKKLSDAELIALLKQSYPLDEQKNQPTGIYLLFKHADKHPQLVLDIWSRVGKLITLADLRTLPCSNSCAALLQLAHTAVAYPKLMQAVLANLQNQLSLEDLRLRPNLTKGVLVVLFHLAKACDNLDPALQACAIENFISVLKQFSPHILIDSFTCKTKNISIIQLLEKLELYTLRNQILSQVSGMLEEKDFKTQFTKRFHHQRDTLEPLIKARNALAMTLYAIKNDPTLLNAELLQQLADKAHQAGFLPAWLDVGQCFLLVKRKEEALAAFKRVPQEAWQYQHAQQQVAKLTQPLVEAALAVSSGAPAVIYSNKKKKAEEDESEMPEKVTGKRYPKKPK